MNSKEAPFKEDMSLRAISGLSGLISDYSFFIGLKE
jgi:hypothetical protein